MAPRRVLTPGAPIVRLKVELAEVRPRVWRRVEVPAAATLAELHEVLQEAMAWTDSHLHEFEVDGRSGSRWPVDDFPPPS
jgi:hypothetical protein